MADKTQQFIDFLKKKNVDSKAYLEFTGDEQQRLLNEFSRGQPGLVKTTPSLNTMVKNVAKRAGVAAKPDSDVVEFANFLHQRQMTAQTFGKLENPEKQKLQSQFAEAKGGLVKTAPSIVKLTNDLPKAESWLKQNPPAKVTAAIKPQAVGLKPLGLPGTPLKPQGKVSAPGVASLLKSLAPVSGETGAVQGTPEPLGEELDQFLGAARLSSYTWEDDGSGVFGAYLFQPDQYAAAAAKLGLNPNDHTPSSQDKVARYMATKYGQETKSNWKAVANKWWGGENTERGDATIEVAPGQFRKLNGKDYWKRISDRIMGKQTGSDLGLGQLGQEITAGETTGAGSGSGRAPLSVQLSSPTDIRMTMEDVAQKVLGRNPTESEMTQFVQLYQGMERQFQTRAYSTSAYGGTSTQPPNMQAQAIQSLRQGAPIEAGAQQVGDVIDQIKNIFTKPVVTGV